MAAPDRRDRVRRRILDTAGMLLTRDATTSLGSIASAAGVGRTTVHRYFPTRESLLVALGLEAIERVSTAIDDARADDGPVPAVLERMVDRVLPLGDALRYLDLGPELWDLPELVHAWYPLEQTLEGVVVRGQREGDLRSDVPAALVADLMVAAIWGVGESVRQGRVAPADAAPGLLRVLLGGAATSGAAQ